MKKNLKKIREEAEERIKKIREEAEIKKSADILSQKNQLNEFKEKYKELERNFDILQQKNQLKELQEKVDNLKNITDESELEESILEIVDFMYYGEDNDNENEILEFKEIHKFLRENYKSHLLKLLSKNKEINFE